MAAEERKDVTPEMIQASVAESLSRGVGCQAHTRAVLRRVWWTQAAPFC